MLFIAWIYSFRTVSAEKVPVELQKKTLDTFLEKNAISRLQYDKSLGDLRVKMGMSHVK